LKGRGFQPGRPSLLRIQGTARKPRAVKTPNARNFSTHALASSLPFSAQARISRSAKAITRKVAKKVSAGAKKAKKAASKTKSKAKKTVKKAAKKVRRGRR